MKRSELVNDLVIILLSKDRLEFLKFRQRTIKVYGYDMFKQILNKANNELAQT